MHTVWCDRGSAENRGQREGGREGGGTEGGRESDEKSLNQLLPLSSVREATTDSTHPPTYYTAPLCWELFGQRAVVSIQ